MPNRGYEPTQKEIREMCEEIQKSWTPEERIQRMHGGHGDPDRPHVLEIQSGFGAWTPPLVKAHVSNPEPEILF